MLHPHLRFRDLKARGVVNNWVTLANWINNEGFPAGCLAGPNTRLWDELASPSLPGPRRAARPRDGYAHATPMDRLAAHGRGAAACARTTGRHCRA